MPDDVVGSDIVKKAGRQGGDCTHPCHLFDIKACQKPLAVFRGFPLWHRLVTNCQLE